MLKYYRYKLSTLHGKKTKQPVFTVTLIRCIGFNQPPHNLASEQSFYNIVDKADHIKCLIYRDCCYKATFFFHVCSLWVMCRFMYA